MAGEIEINLALYFQKSGASVQKVHATALDVSGTLFAHGVQNIGTSEEALTKVDGLTTPGYVYVRNLDTSNFVTIGAVTGQYSIKLKPGELTLFRVNSPNIYARADTAACDVEYIIIED